MVGPNFSSGELPDYDSFYTVTRRRVVGAVALVTHDAAAAEDAAQEAYSRAYLRWDHVREMQRPDLWVLRAATRLAIDSWRKRRRENDLEDDHVHPAEDLVQRKWLEWGLDQLTPAQRRVLVMREAHGWTFTDIARETNSSEAAVRQQVHRALGRLRRILTAEAPL